MAKKIKNKAKNTEGIKVFSSVRVSESAGVKVVQVAESEKRTEAQQAAYIIEQWANNLA